MTSFFTHWAISLGLCNQMQRLASMWWRKPKDFLDWSVPNWRRDQSSDHLICVWHRTMPTLLSFFVCFKTVCRTRIFKKPFVDGSPVQVALTSWQSFVAITDDHREGGALFWLTALTLLLHREGQKQTDELDKVVFDYPWGRSDGILMFIIEKIAPHL